MAEDDPQLHQSSDEDTLFQSASEAEEARLVINLGAYEGPLHLLLDLARRQKVDLREISILALAEQYLLYIAEAKRMRLDVAAEYLVMAAWLAYLKSRLLLPKPPEDEGPSNEEIEANKRFQLMRLDAMQKAAEQLMARGQLGKEFFARGEPERRSVSTRVEWTASMIDLLRAYAQQRTKENFQPLHLERRAIVAIDEALMRLRRVMGDSLDWLELESFLPNEWRDDDHVRSALASTFAAALELAKHGQINIRQYEVFGSIFVTRRSEEEAPKPAADPPSQRLSELDLQTKRGSAA